MKNVATILLILLLCNNGFAQNLNGSMEQWRTINAGFPVPKTYEAPAGWYGVDSLIASIGFIAGVTDPKKMLFKDADAHSGSFAAKVMTRYQGGSLDTLTGVLVNALPGFDVNNIDPNNPAASLSYTGGTTIASRAESVSAWIKYVPRYDDKGRISVRAIMTGKGAGGTDSTVGTGDTVFTQPIGIYTEVTIHVNYKDTTAKPDKLLVLFYSSNMSSATTVHDSSAMYIDDITAKFAPVHIANVKTNADIQIYPNPATDWLYINGGNGKTYSIDIYNSTGAKVLFSNVISKAIDISKLSSGSYYYSLEEEKTVVQQGAFTVVR